ncbi:unnamed protein product [Acanthoscelides obtectus]|uniref:Uncharacterized protein n=1 Tax=Acanthoscelides obtectus TaxID=200917 RepID=A0A9P0PTJ1_ACAOB|nr:unnamed protein product [Acanthoscelides obtectus]CAK1643801.1 hypothetical protein AOBTE_LOCUS13680 [Acanthoscelides obtectus]
MEANDDKIKVLQDTSRMTVSFRQERVPHQNTCAGIYIDLMKMDQTMNLNHSQKTRNKESSKSVQQFRRSSVTYTTHVHKKKMSE